jgi:putative membrane protein
MHWFYETSYDMAGMHGLWWIFWVVLVAVLVFALCARPEGRRQHPHETPREILRRRLANGDITPEQYEERKSLLERD